MAVLTLPNTLTPGTFEDVGDVQENFAAISALVNGGLDGANLTQAAGEALSVSGTNLPRRGNGNTTALMLLSTAGVYQQVARAPSIVMPTAGVLHVGAWARFLLTDSLAATISCAIRLNGAAAKSRFGTAPASGASTGLMELTGIGLPYTGGQPASSVVVFTAPTDTGLDSLTSTSGYPSDDQSSGHPMGALVPIAVTPGAYVVDLMVRMDTGLSVAYGNTARLAVKSEAF